jgi:S-DNA-T family DNA segregation ATPase FtsK/SpoIIIE
VGLVTDLDEGLAARALVSLEAEVHRRERLLRQSGSTDLAGHRAAVGSSPLPRLVVVIDEFAALAADLPDFIPALVGIAQRGRSLGVHLVLATQRPAGVVDDHIRANTNLRLALRLHDRADALDVVGDPSPASLPRGVAGRAVMRLGPGDMAEFQIARCTAPIDNAADPARTELEALVEEVRRASTIVDVGAPHRPWLASLPRELREVDAPDAVGVVDEPALQRRSPLRWDRARGNLALVGALGSGTTTALRTVVMVATSLDPPRRLHVYVVDARGDAALTALAGPHCSGVIRLHETERVDRLLHRLATDLEHRRAGAAADRGPDIVVAIDGLIALRETLDHVDRGPSLAALDRVLADGPAVGIATIAVIDAARGGSVLARFAQRWVFHLDDPADAPTLGVPSARVPPAVPGRLVVAASGLEAHVALIERDPHEGEGSPLPVEILAGVVPVNTLGRMSAPVGPVVALPVGLDFVTLATAALNVPIGEHVLIVGPARSGRSSALIRLIEAWREHHPGAGVTVICPTRSSPLVARYGAASGLDTLLLDNADPDGLIAVDDCERLDDPDGRLAHQLDRRAGAPTVLAAGRADALRVAYGHWTTICRRSRLGLVMAAGAELDGDVLGAVLPRRAPVPARPGLAWLVDGNGHSLVQVALDP